MFSQWIKSANEFNPAVKVCYDNSPVAKYNYLLETKYFE